MKAGFISVVRVLVGVAIVVLCTSAVFADTVTRVNVMPDRQVRPGVVLPVFGSADGGNGLHNGTGATFAWTFAPNACVSITSSTPTTGAISNDRYIETDTKFLLGCSSTRQTITATLTVTATDTTTASKSVKIDIVDPTDAISNTPLNNLAINANISIEDGLRAMYLAQSTTQDYGYGAWAYGSRYEATDCATTAFNIWAFSNSGHRPTNVTHPTLDMSRDIYSEWVQKAIDYIMSGAGDMTSFANQPRLVDVAAGNPTGTPDADGNGHILDLCYSNEYYRFLYGDAYYNTAYYSREGYASPVAAAAIEAAYSGFPLDAYVNIPRGASSGAAFYNGKTYKQIIQDASDWIVFAQADDPSNTQAYYRGGWGYEANNGNGDTSVDSWNYVALEGSEEVMKLDVPDAAKRESELRVDGSQYDGCGGAPATCMANGTYGRFGYAYDTYAVGYNEQAKTAGGLSGLNMVSHKRSGITMVPRTGYYLDPAGLGSATATARFSGGGATTLGSFGDIATRKAADVAHLGQFFDCDAFGCGGTWGGNRANFYAMWTTARALRLNGTAQLANTKTVSNVTTTTTFNWETGETTVAPGVVPPTGNALEGYFPYLVRTQDSGPSGGAWSGFNNGYWPTNLQTSWAVLILQPKVFPAAGNCDAGAPSIDRLPYPLDHGLRSITITGVPAATQITQICSDENPNFENIPNYAVDGQITTTTTTNDTAKVRAEFSGTRAAPGNGRVYTIYYSAPTLQCSGAVKVRMDTNPAGSPAAVDNLPTWNAVTGAHSCPVP